MGQVENYFPRTSFHDDATDFFNLDLNADMNKISAVEKRTPYPIPKFENAFNKTMNHIKATEYVVYVAPKLKSLMQIFNATQTRELITNKFGDTIYKNLSTHLKSLQLNQLLDYESTMDKIGGKILRNWAAAKTNTPSVLMKQATSFIPYSEGKDKLTFFKYYIEGILNLRSTKEFMLKLSPYLDYRYADDDNMKKTNEITRQKKVKELNDIVSDTMDKANVFEMIKSFFKKKGRNFESLANIGDRISVIYGGYARYKTSIEMGLTQEEALKDMEYQTATTQQSDLKSLQSNKAKSKGFIMVLTNLFRTQEQQYLSKSATSIINIIKKEANVNTKEAIIMYNLFLPLVMTAIGGLINNIYGKEDKDIWYYLNDYFWNVNTSFFGLNYIYFWAKQTNTLIRSRGKDFKSLLLDAADTITQMPVENTTRLFLLRRVKNEKLKIIIKFKIKNYEKS
jgi:hypothetical protein